MTSAERPTLTGTGPCASGWSRRRPTSRVSSPTSRPCAASSTARGRSPASTMFYRASDTRPTHTKHDELSEARYVGRKRWLQLALGNWVATSPGSAFRWTADTSSIISAGSPRCRDAAVRSGRGPARAGCIAPPRQGWFDANRCRASRISSPCVLHTGLRRFRARERRRSADSRPDRVRE